VTEGNDAHGQIICSAVPTSATILACVHNGWPLIGDAWEVPNGPHLVGHPVNLEIYHWFTINGYNDWGNQTQYMDSATTIWPSVPPYTSNFSSSTLVTILGGRGYVW
jgi:hypothetical protein